MGKIAEKFEGHAELRKIALACSESLEAILKAKAAKTTTERIKAFAILGDDVVNLVMLDWQKAKREWQARTPETFTLLMDDIRNEFEIENPGLEAQIEASIEGGLFIIEELAAMADRWKDRFPLVAA